MRNAIARWMIKRMGSRYDYDVSYQLYLLAQAPKAYWKFARLSAVARHRESAPSEAVLTVSLLGAMAEDCGPCTQLIAQMAQERGMASDLIEAVLTHNTVAMTPSIALAYRYGEAVLGRAAAEDLREEVRARWGEKGVIDLALAMLAGRLFPIAKSALGYDRQCRYVSIEGRSIKVAKPMT